MKAAKPDNVAPRSPDVREGFVGVGVVLTSFGLKGDLKVEPLTDFPERFAPGAHLWLAGHERTVERSRWQRGIVFVKLTGIDRPEAVAQVRGYPLELPEAERAELGANEFYQSDILGLRVLTSGGEELGRVREFLPTGANDVLLVEGPRGEVLVPMIDDIVRAIDLAAGTITIEPLEGLLPEPRVPRPPRLPSWRYKQLRRQGSAPPPR
ncbi:MAG TPA: ribosome maturation factor RimM [Dehalococcoidia bacterium]|nr:ribosome maturation factor RimM [Dehalococcoidia bacterium]